LKDDYGCGMKLILASGSPRRRELLKEMGYDFDIVVPDVDEDIIQGEAPSDHVLRISKKKAALVARDFPDDIVLGADTIVVLDGRIFGKPESRLAAKDMLETLSGRAHIVYTGLTVINSSACVTISRYDSTEVVFNDLAEDEIEKYIESGEPLDKAGAYGIQGMGSFLVGRYEGELDTVIGFPRKLFKEMYREIESCQ